MPQYSVDLRDARNDAIETILGASPILELRTGAAPATCATADSGTLVASMTLPADAFAASSGGVKSMQGTWEDLLANNAGIIGHYRFKTSGGVCKMQGSASLAGGGGEMILTNTNVAVNQPVSVTSFAITAGGA